MQFLSPMEGIFNALNPADQNVRQCLSPLPDISKSVPDLSGMIELKGKAFTKTQISSI